MKKPSKNNLHNIQVGQVVYRIKNEWGGSSVEDCVVEKVGTKYFEISNAIHGEGRINLDTLQYTNERHRAFNYRVYLDRQDAVGLVEFNELYLKIQTKFSGFKGSKERLSLGQLREIAKILNINP